ncbi:MAG: hypothetical protein JWP87_800 [Labilithrix sp.]|nr:hypothetical protein [Labilithrix sp.]
MRSHKFLIVSASILATTTLTTLSFADDTTNGSTSATPGGSSTVTSQTVMTPSAPSVPTTSTTITSQGSTSTGTSTTTPSTPTSTTTTTSADDVSASAPTPTVTSEPTPRESVTVYDKRRPNKAVLITGTSFLVSTYATTAALAAANGPVADKDLYIPVVGPWINLASRDTNRPDNTRDSLLIAGSGVLQGLGAAMMVTSFFVPEKIPTARISAGNVKMQVAPALGGVGAIGTF